LTGELLHLYRRERGISLESLEKGGDIGDIGERAEACLATAGKLVGVDGGIPSGYVKITMERSTIFNGKIHYFYGHFQ